MHHFFILLFLSLLSLCAFRYVVVKVDIVALVCYVNQLDFRLRSRGCWLFPVVQGVPRLFHGTNIYNHVSGVSQMLPQVLR